MSATRTAGRPAVAQPEPRRQRTWRGIPVVLPNPRDPRLHVAGVILSLHVLGQVALEFKVSIAQIVVTILATGLVEMAITYRRQRMLVWPASAMLTGSGVAFILRASGTQHGDWWTLHGIGWFLAAALLGLGSKYVLQIRGRHLYNPSNFGLVLVLLVVGSPWVFPQYLYWGELSPPVLLAIAFILAGVVAILRPLRMLGMAAAFLVPFGAAIGLIAASGRCFEAVWRTGPICGIEMWQAICLSPELLVFVFYMMSDPKTAPRAARARVAYGLLTALVASALIAPQATEYGVKVALLASLVMVCSAVPLLERWAARGTGTEAPTRLLGLANPVAAGAAALVLLVPIGVAQLAGDERLLLLERGITPANGPPPQ